MKLRFVVWSLFASTTVAALASAQEPFYKDKTIRIVVPFAAGGGYDIYSRIMGRHMGKYIPGNPAIVSERSSCKLEEAARFVASCR